MEDLNGKWTFADNEDDLSPIIDWFDTKEEAIEEGKNVYDKESFIVTQLKPIALPYLDVITLLEKLETDYIYDVNSDTDISLFDNLSEEDGEWFQAQLDSLIDDFYKRAKIKSNYYSFDNIEYIQGEE